MSEINSFKVIIVGAGPAGLTSAIYTARAGISTLVFGSPYESQVAKLDIIENYPGFSKGVHGMERRSWYGAHGIYGKTSTS
ncbi:MAG: FAD-dependent oxidoreductase [Candidatus Heimdallarchaeota archaeon]